MYHSITFSNQNGEKNTWDDWHLIPASRPVFNPPKPKTLFVDIPGANGHLDLSESVSGEVVYEARTGSMEFIVDNGHREWHELYSEIMNYLHGRSTKATLEDDPDYYYEGRFTINQWKSDPHNSRITIDYTVGPYKMEHSSSDHDWLWDDFNFNTDVIKDYENRQVDGTLVVGIFGNTMSVVPLIIANIEEGSTLKVEYNNSGNSLDLKDGLNALVGYKIRYGENIFTFTGKGTVTIDYRGGSL